MHTNARNRTALWHPLGVPCFLASHAITQLFLTPRVDHIAV